MNLWPRGEGRGGTFHEVCRNLFPAPVDVAVCSRLGVLAPGEPGVISFWPRGCDALGGGIFFGYVIPDRGVMRYRGTRYGVELLEHESCTCSGGLGAVYARKPRDCSPAVVLKAHR